jgi:hypothetical protein
MPNAAIRRILDLPGRLEQPLDLVALPPRLATRDYPRKVLIQRSSPYRFMAFSISMQSLLSKVPYLGGGGAEEEPEHPIRRYARPVLGAFQLGEVDRPPEEGCGEP